ncbi:tape measure protein [Cecembia rubra]|uniref:Tape measure domain-containing protein n=1 Tax=Cecembia rubra TaxID=1485585 RepID=A0A2P8EAN7_9BACT|nr:tape measure protein [Cecembia rubra]PSL06538.1 tape measure domain-containing protein [Cecembia rubra]
MEKLEPISVEFLINNPEFTRSSQKVRNEIKGISDTAVSEAERAEMVYKKLGAAIAGYFSINAIGGFISEVARVRGEFQQLDISLETIIGNKEKADEVLARSVELAAKTPFSLTDVGNATKQLLAYGTSTESVTDTLRRLGDVSAGLSIPLNDLTYLYGTTRVQGRLFAQDLQQFVGRGIPLTAELAKQFGVAESEVKELVSQGKVGFKEVEIAINNLTDEGGIFFNLMEKQSASITGKLSNLGDAFDRMYNEIGEGNEGLISDSLSGIISLVENYQTVVDVVKGLIVTYGTYRAAVMLTAAAHNAAALSAKGLTATQILQQKWTVLATRAQALLNATMLANPYVAAATALTALISALVIYNKNTDKGVKLSEDFKNSIKEEVTASNELFKSLKAAAEGTEERSKMIEKINKTYKEYLPSQLTEKTNLEEIEAAQKAVNKAIAESVFLRSQESDIADLKSKTQKLSKNWGVQVVDAIKDAQLSSTIGAQLSAEFDKAIEEFSQFSNVPAAQVQSRFDKILRDFGLDISVLGSGNDISTYNYDYLIKGAQKYAAAINREKTETEQLAEAKTAYLKQLGLLNEEEEKSEEISQQAITTLKALKEQLQLLSEERDNIDVADTESLAANEREQKALQQKIAALEIKSVKEKEKESKKTELELLKQRLDEKRKQYEDYYRAIELMGRETADAQFADLIKSSGTYLQYLEQEQSKINQKSADAPRQNVLIRQEIQQASGELSPLERLRSEISEMKKVFEDFETYKKQFGVESAREQFASQLGEYETYLDFITQKTEDNQDALTAVMEGTATDQAREITRVLTEESNEALRQQRRAYEEQLAELKTYQKERERIIQNFRETESKLIADGKFEELEILRESHQKELDELDDNNVKKIAVYKELQSGIAEMSVKSARMLVSRLKQMLASENMSEELRAEIARAIVKFEQEIGETNFRNIFQIATAIGNLGQSLANLGQVTGNKGLSNIGGILSGMASGVGDLLTVLDKTSTDTDKITAGISSVIRMVDMLASAAERRKQAEEEYYRNVLGFQRQYNLSLNEQIRLQSILGENVFLKDFEGRIRDGLASINRANEEYQKALEELSKGRAKAGTRSAIDWGNVGTGAATGAVIGSAIVPVIGTAIGAVVGAVAGLFGGKKKVDNLVPVLQEYPELLEMTESGVLKLNRALADSLIQNNMIDESTKGILENIIAWEEEMESARQQIRDVVSELVGTMGNDIRNSLVEAFKSGENAALAMGETVDKVLENMITQILFHKIFGDVFDQFEEQIVGAIASGDVGELTRSFEDFFSQAQSSAEVFNDALSAAQQAAEGSGFNLFKKGGENNQKGLSGAIRREMTEATASELAGLFRGFFDVSKRTLEANVKMLETDRLHYEAALESLSYQAAIAHNTGETSDKLDAVYTELKEIKKNTKPQQGTRDLGLG